MWTLPVIRVSAVSTPRPARCAYASAPLPAKKLKKWREGRDVKKEGVRGKKEYPVEGRETERETARAREKAGEK